jgi:hypothetical protein
MASLKDFSVEKWWNLLVAAGVAIAVAAITKQSLPGILIGLSLVFFGTGESANHPLWTDIKGPPLRKVTHHPWKPRPLGIILDVIGVGLFGLGLTELLGFTHFQTAFVP